MLRAKETSSPSPVNFTPNAARSLDNHYTNLDSKGLRGYCHRYMAYNSHNVYYSVP